MNGLDHAALRALMMEEFMRHRSTARGTDDPRWVCKCGVEVPTDERGYPMGREHIVDRLLDILLAEPDCLLPELRLLRELRRAFNDMPIYDSAYNDPPDAPTHKYATVEWADLVKVQDIDEQLDRLLDDGDKQR